jgi:ligand-binding sensor domain-containing protein
VYLRAAMLLLVLLCGALPAAAQPVPPSPRQVTVFDGLPSNTVNRMAEDRYGYLWIATNDGLARYDGRTTGSGVRRMDCVTTASGRCWSMPATSCG